MKLRIILKELKDPFVNSPSYSNNKSKLALDLLSSISKHEIVIEYCYANDTCALLLKQFIAKRIHMASDCIELFYKDNNNSGANCYFELNDSDCLTKLQSQMQNSNTLNNSTILRTIDDDIVLYYKLILYRVQVKIDVYQKNINSLSQTVSLCCSILNLKHFLMEKFKMDDDSNPNSNTDSTINVVNQKIFSLSLSNKSKKIKIKQMANKEYNDRMKLIDIIKEYEDQKRTRFSFNDNISLKFLLVLNTREAIKMGLNFNFNYFKNLSQISFEHSAPVHRECSDGLNLFSYCRNTQCLLFNEMFVRCLGYGSFNVMNEVIRTRCPKCLCASLTEGRNLGMINAKWEYKGVLNGKRNSGFEGDGVTIINNKLYLFSEVKLSSTFGKLLIKIRPHKANNDLNVAEAEMEPKANKGIGLRIGNDESLFDSVPLCLVEKNYEGIFHESNMSKASKVDMVISRCHILSNSNEKANGLNSNNDPGINMLSSQANKDRDDYCLNRCLTTKNSTGSCAII